MNMRREKIDTKKNKVHLQENTISEMEKKKKKTTSHDGIDSMSSVWLSYSMGWYHCLGNHFVWQSIVTLN